MAKFRHNPLTACCAISRENGIEVLNIYEGHINQQRFSEIMPVIGHFGKNVLLIGDQATWHKGPDVTKEMNKINAGMVFNPAWNPYLNAIETVFAWLRKKYNSIRIEAMVMGR